ncbi:MAG: DUF2066 domain-containing protein [Pseudomonadota bacterium]
MLRFFLVIMAFFASATASELVFTVPEVPVFAEAKSSALAQRRARDQGRAVAFDILMRRLVAEADWIYLPVVSSDRPAPAAARTSGVYAETINEAQAAVGKTAVIVDRDTLRSFEQETNVFNEKSSGTTYRASITYRFKPELIRALLQQSRLPYAEEQAREAMVLPVLATDNGVYLWEAKNPWARAWLAKPLSSELTPMILPRGDILDVQAISAEEALNLNAAQLQAFSERYNAPRLLIALGRLAERGTSLNFNVKLIEATPGAEGGRLGFGTPIADVSFRGTADDFPALARQAVTGTLDQHARRWKNQTLVDYSLRRTFELTAWFSDTREWADIQNAIDATALVVGRRDGVFNNNTTKIELTVVGESEQFRLAMAQFDLDVWQDTNGVWHIAEKTRAAELKKTLIPMDPARAQQNAEQERERRGLGRIFGRRNRDEEEVPDLPEDLFGDDPDGR